MKVVHITPTYFDGDSLIGGGERYPTELAIKMSKYVDTTLVSFSSKRKSIEKGSLKIEIFPVRYLIKGNKMNPLSFKYLSSITNVDVVHIHHINTLISDLGCLVGFYFGKTLFTTDHGGGADFVLNQKLPVFQCYEKAIAQSSFAIDFLPFYLQKKALVIKGGIDVERFHSKPTIQKQKKILYVGRVLPHKGINYLIDGFRLLNLPDYKLVILGRVYNKKFYQDLKQLADGLPVEFIHDADDQRLLNGYQTALVTVLPSVHTTCYGDYTPVPELMGFTLLESQACGTPVICTDAGAMPEFVDHGRTGFVVQQNSGAAIAAALRRILALSAIEYQDFQMNCLNWVKPLSWENVVQQHLEIYQAK